MFYKTVHQLHIDLSTVDYQCRISKVCKAQESEGTYCIACVHMYTYYVDVCAWQKNKIFAFKIRMPTSCAPYCCCYGVANFIVQNKLPTVLWLGSRVLLQVTISDVD